MNNSKEIQSVSRKREKYAQTIRKEKRHHMIQKMRKIYFSQNQNQIQTQHQSQFQNQLQTKKDEKNTITVQDLVRGFDLHYNPQFSKQSIQHNPFYLVDILLAKQSNLINITFKNNPTNLIDQKRLSPPNSQFQMQQTYLPQQYSFELQTMLYRLISVDMLTHQKKYQTMQKSKQSQLITFWLQYLSRNKYTETMLKKTYHQQIINFLKLFMAEIWSQDLSEKILSWVNGTQSLQLIFNCLTGQFINCIKYSNIYEIIILGLKSNDLAIKRDSIDVLLNCIRSSDYDQIEQLLQHKPQVFIELCQFFNNQLVQKAMYNEIQVMNSLIKAGYCINLFLWTYDENILACLKQGAGYVGAKLICTTNIALIKQGLQMFQLIANIQQRQYARQAQLFLIMNTSIRDTCVWHKLATTYDIICHSDDSIRQKFISFINSFLCNAQLNQICLLLNEFQIPLIDCLVELFVESQNLNVMKGILMIFQSLFYYNRGENDQYDEYEEYGIEERGRLKLGEMYQSEYVACKMGEKGMIKKMMGLVELQSRPIDDTLKEQIEPLLEYLYRINSRENL